MKAFPYERAGSPKDAAAALLKTPRAQVHRRRHQPARPDEAADRDAQRTWWTSTDVGLDSIEATDEGGLRIGALVRNTDLAADKRRASRLPLLSRALVAGASGQLRNKATTGRQPAAAHALPVLLRHRLSPATSACPAAAARAIEGFNRTARRRRRQPGLHRHPPQRHGGGHARAGRVDGDRQRLRADRAHSAGRCIVAPGTTPHLETVLQRGELITAVTLPQAAGRHARLPQGARPRVLRLRAGVGGGGSCSATASARWPRRRGAQAVAQPEADASHAARGQGRRPISCCAGAHPKHNAFKLPLVERTCAAILAEARA